MAGLASGDRPPSGALEGQQDSSAPASREGEDARSVSLGEQTRAEAGRSRLAFDENAARGNDGAAERDHPRVSDDNGEHDGDQDAEPQRRAMERRDAAWAAADREQAANDRKQAVRDHVHAEADRDTLLREVAVAEASQIADSRMAGLAELENEIDRSRRTSTPLVVAYVDLIDPDRTDADAHSTCDALLLRVVCAIRDRLRSYDLIVRLPGDAMLCVMSGATIETSCQRLAAVQSAFADDADPGHIGLGFAALAPADNAAGLIKRAAAAQHTRPVVGFP